MQEDENHENIRPVIMRQASENAEREKKECFCSDLITAATGNLRLKCRCLVHYHCLVSHIRAKLSDRMSIDKNGIVCPYGRSSFSH